MSPQAANPPRSFEQARQIDRNLRPVALLAVTLVVSGALAAAQQNSPKTIVSPLKSQSSQPALTVQPPLSNPEPEPAEPSAPVSLSVKLSGGTLTIDAENAPLIQILDAIHQQTGADIDSLPDMDEKYIIHLAGPPRAVLSDLLSSSGFGYVIMGSADDPSKVVRLIFEKLSNPASSAGTNTPPSRRVWATRNSSGSVPAPASSEETHFDDSPLGNVPVTSQPFLPGGSSYRDITAGNSSDKSAPATQNPSDPQPVSDSSTPAVPDSKPAAQTDPKASPASQMLQEMYKARQQLQPTTPQ